MHDSIQIIDQVYSSCPDLMDVLLEQPDLKVVVDESSFMDQGQCRAGYATVTHQEILEADALPPCTSAQKAKRNKGSSSR